MDFGPSFPSKSTWFVRLWYKFRLFGLFSILDCMLALIESLQDLILLTNFLSSYTLPSEKTFILPLKGFQPLMKSSYDLSSIVSGSQQEGPIGLLIVVTCDGLNIRSLLKQFLPPGRCSLSLGVMSRSLSSKICSSILLSSISSSLSRFLSPGAEIDLVRPGCFLGALRLNYTLGMLEVATKNLLSFRT